MISTKMNKKLKNWLMSVFHIKGYRSVIGAHVDFHIIGKPLILIGLVGVTMWTLIVIIWNIVKIIIKLTLTIVISFFVWLFMVFVKTPNATVIGVFISTFKDLGEGWETFVENLGME